MKLKTTQQSQKISNKPIRRVLVGGCFDVLHFGHIMFLKEAKKLGDVLIILLESDEKVRTMKGDKRPIHTQRQRATMLDALLCVDEVVMLPSVTTDTYYKELVSGIKPSIIAVTEGDPIVDKKRVQAESIGAQLTVIPKIHTPSTSQLAKLLGLE